MSLETLLPLLIKISIVLTVFSLGLQASWRDATHLLRNPGLLVRSLIAMNVVMPLVACALVAAVDLHPAVKIALVALSVSPVPPLLPRKQLKAGSGTENTFGLLVGAALLAIVTIPLTLEIFSKVFGVAIHMAPSAVAALVLVTVLGPLGAGIAVREFAPPLAARIAKPVGIFAAILLVAAVLPILFTTIHAVVSLIGNGTLLTFASFVVIGLLTGHILGGPDGDHKTALALSSAARHPGIALSIAHVNFPEQKLALTAVLLYLIVCALLSIPYVKWRHKLDTSSPGLPVSGRA